MSYITRQDNNDDQLTLYVEHEGAGIKFTICSRLNPADSKSITLGLDQAAHLALDVAEAAIPEGVQPQSAERTRGVQAGNYVVHIPRGLRTVCGRDVSAVNCFPEATPEGRAEQAREEQCCRICCRRTLAGET